MNSPAIVAGVAPALEVLRVEGPQRMEALGQPVDAITVTIRRHINEEEMLALSTTDLANCLGYVKSSSGVRAIIKRHAKELAAWVVTGSELKKHAPQRIVAPLDERLWIVGPGLDLILMFSAQPKAVDFRAWLSERSLELRTKGVTYASPQAKPSEDAALSPAVVQLISTLMASQERMMTAIIDRLDARLAEPRPIPAVREEPPPPPPEPRFVEPEDIGEKLPPGWATASELARRVGWFSKASKGRLPHPQAVVLAALNDGFSQSPECFATRERVIEGSSGPRLAPQRVFTAKGVERFMRNVAPIYEAHDSFAVQPNYRAIKAGQRGVQSVVRQSID